MVTDISEAMSTAADEVVVTELALANELLAACLGRLSLRRLPHVACVNHRWQEAALVAFESQLRWRADARCVPLSLPVLAVPARTILKSQIIRSGFSLAFLRSGELVVQIVDADHTAIRTVSFADGALQAYELPGRGFAEHGPFNAGVGGVVGYRRNFDARGTKGMAFFPLVCRGGAAASDAVWVAEGFWQNVLQAGNIIFLLRAHKWWDDEERITADLVDSDSGGRATVDVTPLRDALKRALGQELPARGAVSAAHGHFIFHLATQSGGKAAAALRLPATISPGSCFGSAVDSGVAFARRWPATHAIARLRTANEEPCGAHLMLWDDADPAARPSSGSEAERRFAVSVVLLHAATGVAVGRDLLAPAADGPQAQVAVAFLHGGVAAIDFNATSGVVAACSLPRTGLPPPALLVWDWRSAACLQSVLFHPLSEAPRPAAPRSPRPLRFPVGAPVECRMSASLWLPGVVAAQHVSAGVPGQATVPYLVHLDRGDSCYAHLDRDDLIRSAGGGGELAWNERTQAMEVAATASLAIHPSSSRLAIGMWHEHALAGVLFSVDIRPHGVAA